ncbi:MAG: tRNA 2-thiouridine(34) synthase MnmA [Candidatus Vogelbacteria bacterium]
MVKSKKLKVFVAMSGGVDSSVAAALLKKAGYDVTGVFIKIWAPELSACDWREERRDAMRVAARIGVPLLTFDLSADYKKLVIDYLLKEYRAGRTPNPDVMCNKEIKFGIFYREALKRGADYIATGHYAQNQLLGSSFQLLASADKAKDQTYFLWTLTSEILTKTLFPIGKYKKPKVRKLATKFGLVNAEKPDSQGLCFLGKINFKDFLEQYLPKKKGKVLDEMGKEIGEHNGAYFYTIGERHGFRVTAQTPNAAPLYIIAKDIKKNILVVSAQPVASQSARREIMLNSVNWISGASPASNKIIKARIRYRAPLVACRVENLTGHRARVTFTKPLFGATPGQSCVFFDSLGLTCLGGGVIT